MRFYRLQKIRPDPISRRWHQFSFRSLLLFSLLVGVATGMITKAETQRRAVATIRALGGEVEYGYRGLAGWLPCLAWLQRLVGEDFFGVVTKVKLGGQSVTDKDLKALSKLPHIAWLELWDTDVTGVGLEHLAQPLRLQCLFLGRCPINDRGMVTVGRFTQLRMLNLEKSQATDAGLRHLIPLKQLELLDLHNVVVTDVGLESLSHLINLRRLYLRGNAIQKTPVTSAGMAHLKSLNRLELLHLNHTLVGDDGLQHLAALPHLRRVYLLASAVSAEGRRVFQATRPDVRFYEQ